MQTTVLVALARRIAGGRVSNTLLEESPVKSHQSLGGVERYHRLAHEQTRVLRGYLEAQLGESISVGIP